MVVRGGEASQQGVCGGKIHLCAFPRKKKRARRGNSKLNRERWAMVGERMKPWIGLAVTPTATK